MGNRISKYLNREKDTKVIFLDFDGVLNNKYDGYEQNGIVKFSQRNMKKLKTLVDQTNAVFVLSTAHRYRETSLDHFKATCENYDISYIIYGKTKYHPEMASINKGIYQREQEIKEWLNDHPDIRDEKYGNRWVAIDDCLLDLEHFVHTSYISGLRKCNAREAIEYLNRPKLPEEFEKEVEV